MVSTVSVTRKGALAKPLARSILRHWQLYVVIALPVAMVITFNYIPMYGVIIAFKNFKASKGIMGSSWVGLKYFQQFFGNRASMGIVLNTLKVSLYSIAAGFPLPILLAIGLNEMKSPVFKKAVQMVTYAPYFISTVVLVGMLIQFSDPRTGLFNLLFRALGLDPVNFMAKEGLFVHLYVWSGVWQSTGYGAVIYLAALSSVSPELYEAAFIDGANKWRRIWHIDVPSILPTAAILLILSFGQIMNVGFEKAYLMQNAANINASEVIATYVYKIGLISMNMSFSTAINLFNSMVNLLMILSVNYVAGRLNQTSLM
jgi:putative aldouronate transport system permease protein